MRAGTSALLASVVLAMPAAAMDRAGGDPWIEYLHVEANEGGASGGHAGFRLGDQVFHFEHRAPGVLRIGREDFEVFRHRYGDLENRSIHAIRVPVTPVTFGLLRDEFARRFLVQNQHFRELEALVTDRRLLEATRAWRRGERAEEPVVVEGVGFFFEEGALPADPVEPSPPIQALRERVSSTYGPEFLTRRMTELEQELARLEVRTVAAGGGSGLSVDRLPAVTETFPQRYRDKMVALLALEALRMARPLRSGSVARRVDDALVLRPGEREAVERLTEAVEASLVRLLRSGRPDWGFPMLVGMARLSTLDGTRRSGRWMILDAFPPGAATIAHARVLRQHDAVVALQAEARQAFEEARARLVGRPLGLPGFPEADFSSFEAAGNRLLELSGALVDGTDLRVHRGPLVPARGAPLSPPLLPALNEADLEEALRSARRREAARAAEVRRLYGYNLVTRNCVTEIFRVVDAALARALPPPGADSPTGVDESPAAVRAESTRRLGGHVETDGILTFVPAVAARVVRDAYAGSEARLIPSYRRSRIARMYREENPLLVLLRESNTLTSTAYRPAARDSAFLFFTDELVITRPLFGALNLLAGFGAAAVGLALSPADDGETLRAGLNGLLFSLPELVFVNVRKGSYEYVSRHDATRDFCGVEPCKSYRPVR